MHRWYVDITTIYESVPRNSALVKLSGGGGGRERKGSFGELQRPWRNVAKSKLSKTKGTSDATTVQVASELLPADEQYPRLKLATILELVTGPSALTLLVYLAAPREKVEPGTGSSIMLKGPFAQLLV
jgi:hypothetical protein